jgi:hypothetical protein
MITIIASFLSWISLIVQRCWINLVDKRTKDAHRRTSRWLKLVGSIRGVIRLLIAETSVHMSCDFLQSPQSNGISLVKDHLVAKSHDI